MDRDEEAESASSPESLLTMSKSTENNKEPEVQAGEAAVQPKAKDKDSMASEQVSGGAAKSKGKEKSRETAQRDAEAAAKQKGKDKERKPVRFETPRLKTRYRAEIVQKLKEEFAYENVMRVPRLVKVIVNMGVGQAIQDPKVLDGALSDLALITGQKPQVTRARKSISNFKLREGMRIGCRVTLRGDLMYEFLEKLFGLTLPRVRDFQGISPDSFDGRGNFAMGLKEQLVFPEIEYDKIDRIRGMNIVVVTTAKTDEEGKALLAALGCPFREV